MATGHGQGGVSALEQWQLAKKFGKGRKLEKPSPAATVVDFAERLKIPRLRTIVEMRFVNGLLAVHQAGSFRALVHPFSRVESSQHAAPLVWSELDVRDFSGKRPFPPFAMPDNRHIIFSAPYAVHVVDVWGVKGWAVQESSEPTPWLDCTEPNGVRVAAAPLAMKNCELGILLRGPNGEYRWFVGPLDWFNEPTTGDALFRVATPARKIQGSPCVVTALNKRVLTVATPTGHWVWPWESAYGWDTDAMTETWPQDDSGGEAPLGTQHESADDFSWSKQFICCPPGYGPQRGREPRFTWYFVQKTGMDSERLKKYAVTFDALDAQPFEIRPERCAYPLGLHKKDLVWEMLFYCDDEIYREDAGGALVRYGAPHRIDSELSGIIFDDPLLMTIESSQSGGRSLTIRSVDHLDEYCPLELPYLYSDPLVWAHWLFTSEMEGDRLILRRRDLRLAARSALDDDNGTREKKDEFSDKTTTPFA